MSQNDDPNPIGVKPFDEQVTVNPQLAQNIMETEHGTKELNDVVDALEELVDAAFSIDASDGVMDDAAELLSDSDLQSAVLNAVVGAQNLKAEVNDLDLDEQTALMHRAVDLVYRIRKHAQDTGGTGA